MRKGRRPVARIVKISEGFVGKTIDVIKNKSYFKFLNAELENHSLIILQVVNEQSHLILKNILVAYELPSLF